MMSGDVAGNGTDKSTLRTRKKELGIASKTRIVLYDIFDTENIKQT